jgi:hypothetical protein
MGDALKRAPILTTLMQSGQSVHAMEIGVTGATGSDVTAAANLPLAGGPLHSKIWPSNSDRPPVTRPGCVRHQDP